MASLIDMLSGATKMGLEQLAQQEQQKAVQSGQAVAQAAKAQGMKQAQLQEKWGQIIPHVQSMQQQVAEAALDPTKKVQVPQELEAILNQDGRYDNLKNDQGMFANETPEMAQELKQAPDADPKVYSSDLVSQEPNQPLNTQPSYMPEKDTMAPSSSPPGQATNQSAVYSGILNVIGGKDKTDSLDPKIVQGVAQKTGLLGSIIKQQMAGGGSDTYQQRLKDLKEREDRAFERKIYLEKLKQNELLDKESRAEARQLKQEQRALELERKKLEIQQEVKQKFSGQDKETKLTTSEAGYTMMVETAKAYMPKIQTMLFNDDGTINRKTLNEARLGASGRGLPGSKGRELAQAMELGIQGITRVETGAAMPQEEVENTRNRFMPRMTDSDDVVVQKYLSYKLFINGYLDLMSKGRDGSGHFNNVKAETETAKMQIKVSGMKDDWMKRAKDANPGVDEKELSAFWNKKLLTDDAFVERLGSKMQEKK